MARRRWIRLGKAALKGAIAVAVIVAVRGYVLKTWTDFRRNGQTLRIDPGWIAAGVGLYLGGLIGFGLVFGRVLAASPGPIGYGPALRAYLISHLGKYVPGKAMVVVIRAGLAAPAGARPATAAFATLYETLVMMAAGGLVAAVGFAAAPGPIQALPLAASLGLGLGFLVLVEPRVFPRLSRLIAVPFPNVGPDAAPKVTRRLLGEGLLMAAGGWLLLGMSQVAVARGIGASPAPGAWPLLIAGVALATVAGFVAGLPGGLFVREWVLMETLTPAVGRDLAVVSSLALRLTWVLGEVLAAATVAPFRPQPPGPSHD